jgi:hypothetical protein
MVGNDLGGRLEAVLLDPVPEVVKVNNYLIFKSLLEFINKHR